MRIVPIVLYLMMFLSILFISLGYVGIALICANVGITVALTHIFYRIE